MIQFQKHPQTALEVFGAIDRGENKFWSAYQKDYAISLLDRAIFVLADLLADYESIRNSVSKAIVKELITVQHYKRVLIDIDNNNSITLINGDKLKLNDGQIAQLRAAQAIRPIMPNYCNGNMEDAMKGLKEMEDELEEEMDTPKPRSVEEIRKEPLDSTVIEFFETGGFWVVGFWALVGVIIYLTW
jgi:hypothetical protein